MKVLVVENEDRTSALVRQLGHTSLAVSTGAMALEKIGAWNPDLVLVDLTSADGIELAGGLRSNLHNAPIVAIAECMDFDQRKAAIDAGIDEFLAKPYKPNELEGMLKRVEARLTESRAIADRSRATAQLKRELSRKSREGLDGHI